MWDGGCVTEWHRTCHWYVKHSATSIQQASDFIFSLYWPRQRCGPGSNHCSDRSMLMFPEEFIKKIDFEVFNAVVFMVLHFTDRSHLDHNFLMVDSSQTNTANTRTSVWPTGNWNTDCFYYSHKWSNTPQLTLEVIYLDWDLFISM